MSSKGEGHIRVVLVDEHEMVREGLSSLLSRDPGLVVAGSYRSTEAFLAAGLCGPLAVIVASPVAGSSCEREFRRIRDAFPEAGLLALTASEADTPILEVIRAGARGYLVKRAPVEQLLMAIHAVARGSSYVSPELSTWFLDRIQSNAQDSRARVLARLSPREIEVMRLVAQGKSSKEVADTLKLEVETVRGYRKNLMRKLGVNKVASLTRLALSLTEEHEGQRGEEPVSPAASPA